MGLSLSHYHTVWTYRLPSILVKKLQRSVVMLRTTNSCVTAEKLHKRQPSWSYCIYLWVLQQFDFATTAFKIQESIIQPYCLPLEGRQKCTCACLLLPLFKLQALVPIIIIIIIIYIYIVQTSIWIYSVALYNYCYIKFMLKVTEAWEKIKNYNKTY